MELHSASAAKRLWNVVRISLFMMRKGLISKRKLVMDMNLMMKKGKLLRKSLSNIISSSKSVTRGSFGIQEYEFSCSNSPNPVFLHVHKRKHHHHFNFPCINHPQVIEEEPQLQGDPLKPINMMLVVPRTPEYSFNLRLDAADFAPGDKKSPLSVRISNFSSEEEAEEGVNAQVDDDAEDFIRRQGGDDDGETFGFGIGILFASALVKAF
ncbi:uncharacterized protein G2W53_024777 [Senna tora]|uniref:Uncharacterized protein n=1 Tax=Senna tora TaxID=362788 RepID=A0A834WE48_9FABA|nr:uncharacterized protein G2W53_024777 [Senna tora]